MSELLTPKELAAYLKTRPQTLANWRAAKTGPRFLKLEGHVRYRMEDVLEWERAGQTGGSPALAAAK